MLTLGSSIHVNNTLCKIDSFITNVKLNMKLSIKKGQNIINIRGRLVEELM
jgi:hypothetical protein